MVSKNYYNLILLCFLIVGIGFPTLTNSSPAGDNILITEVLYDTPGTDSDEEWIELYNPTEAEINITNWKIGDNADNYTIPLAVIPAHSYLTIARVAAGFNALYTYDPDIEGLTLFLGNSGDRLTLYDEYDTIVDFVAWEGYVTGWDVSAYWTTIRRINVVDTDTVNDWEDSTSIGDPGTGTYNVVDETDPIVEILTPLNGSTVSRFVEITVDATDEYGIASYGIYVDNSLIATDSSYIWDSRNVNNGTHEIAAICKDPSNNVGMDNITVTVENEDLITELDLIKIMEYNVEESGIDPDWIEVVKEENPDIVVFIETGTWDDYPDDLLGQYTDELNAYFVDEEPYQSYTAQGISFSTSGEAIMSRFPILESVQIPVVPLDDGSLYDVTHDFMFWNVNISGLEVYIFGAHLKALSGTDNEIRRELETEGIINYMDGLGNHPIIYMGDLNSFSPEDTGDLAPTGDLGYGPLTMMLMPEDPTYGEYSSEVHDFTDVYRTLNPTTPGFTYPSYASRIDFIIVNEYFSGYLINSTVGDTASAGIASDHYCVDFFLDAYALVNEIDITPPGEVQNLNGTAVSTSQIDLTWDANLESDLSHYKVYRDGLFIAQTANTYYNDTGLEQGLWYDYQVVAVDLNGNEGIGSDIISVKTLGEPVITEFSQIEIWLVILTIESIIGLSLITKLRKKKV